MLIRNAQLQGLAAAANNRFVTQVIAHQTAFLPPASPEATGTTAVQTVASLAVAQFHGFVKQGDLAVCATSLAPFLSGAADPAKITGEAAQPLQTLLAHTHGVLSQLPSLPPGVLPSTQQLAVLKQHSDLLAPATGFAPLNIDRSGPVVPFTEQSPVKPDDLAAAAATALPPPGSPPSATPTQAQLADAVQAAKQTFPAVPPGSILHGCLPLVDLEFRRVYWDGTPMPKIPYTVTLADGSKRSGTTDGSGLGTHTGVPPGQANVVYGGDTNPPRSTVDHALDDDFQKILSFRKELAF